MIKKIFCGIVAVAGLVSCTDDYTDWSSPQSNAANEAAEKFEMTITPNVSAIDFANETGETIQLFTSNLGEGQKTDDFNVELTGNGSVTTITANASGAVSTEDLENAVIALYGRAPIERALKANVSADVTITTADNDVVAKKAGQPFDFKAVLDAPQISQNYYIIGGINGTSWNVDNTSLQFNHSGKDVYEDPVFTITIPVAEGENWFAITDQIAIDNFNATGGWDQVLGCAEGNGNNGIEGKVARRSDIGNDGSFKVVVTDGDAELIRITLNMMEYSYKIEKLSALQYFYVVGTPNGWSGDNAYRNMFYTQDATTYTYTTSWTGAWDLKVWDANSLGNWDNAWGTTVDGDGSASGSMINSGAQSFQSPEAGFYTLSINKKDMSYTWTRLDNQTPTEYTSVSLIGDFNGWGGDVDLEQVAAHNWFVEYTVPSNGGLKFRANHAWDTSWGTSDKETAIGDSYYLPIGGENINVPAGTYQFYLNDITGEWNIVKK